LNNTVNASLKKIIDYAYKEVDYYRELFDRNSIDVNADYKKENLYKLPFLTKEIVQNESMRMISNEYKKYPKNQFIDIRRTSGSTGEYLKVYWDRRNDLRSMLSVWRIRKDCYSIEPDMKYCRFYTADYRGNKIVAPKEFETNSNGRILSLYKVGLTHERLKKFYDMILSFNPDWLHLQPSIAYLITQIVKENNLPIPSNLKYIELSGELLLNECRRDVSEVFNIEPVNEYGTNETNVIAIELDDKKLHILEDNVIVEVIKDGKSVIGEEGEICVTSLFNYAMPFIRYQTGDLGIMSHNDSGDVLEVISGRTSDFIILDNGEKLNSYILLGIIQYTNEYMANAIKQFQFIQKEMNKFEVFLVLKEEYKNWANAIKNKFLENVNEERLRNFIWEFDFVDSIFPDKDTGKTKYFKALKL